MANEKSAAIKADRFLDSPLSTLTASQFIDALTAHQAIDHLKYWPEKKKYELEVEPWVDKVNLRDFLDVLNRIKGEKKKVEYEIPDWWKWRVNPDPTQIDLMQRLDQVVTKLDTMASRLGQ